MDLRGPDLCQLLRPRRCFLSQRGPAAPARRQTCPRHSPCLRTGPIDRIAGNLQQRRPGTCQDLASDGAVASALWQQSDTAFLFRSGTQSAVWRAVGGLDPGRSLEVGGVRVLAAVSLVACLRAGFAPTHARPVRVRDRRALPAQPGRRQNPSDCARFRRWLRSRSCDESAASPLAGGRTVGVGSHHAVRSSGSARVGRLRRAGCRERLDVANAGGQREESRHSALR